MVSACFVTCFLLLLLYIFFIFMFLINLITLLKGPQPHGAPSMLANVLAFLHIPPSCSINVYCIDLIQSFWSCGWLGLPNLFLTRSRCFASYICWQQNTTENAEEKHKKYRRNRRNSMSYYILQRARIL